jgi:C4-dicarboxylate-specific signal transduction histidine kinase
MPAQLRQTGIGIVGDVPWGTHFFLFHETKDDLLDTVVPYFKAGLEDRELCIWVIAEPLTEQDVRGALHRAIPGLERHFRDNSMQIVQGREWYLTGDDLDLGKVTRGWKDKMETALARGFSGLRLSADTAWLEKRHWKEFSEYEEEVNHSITDQPMLALCSYPLKGSSAAEILDVTRTHQFAIARRHQRWEMVETSELKLAKAEIKKLNDDLERRVSERTQQLMIANEQMRREMAERERAENALRAAQAELAHVARVTAMGEMAATIVHEVTQPLTGIVTNGNASLRWLDGVPPNLEKARQTVERIIRDGNRASAVIQEVRTLVKKAPPQKVLVNINDLVEGTIALTIGELYRNHVQLDTDLAEDLPQIMGDRVQLQQVLLNLIVNAIEAMSAVSGRTRQLRICSERVTEPEGVSVTVHDSGIGLDGQKIERVFDAFFTTKPQGLGMGLSICRTIVGAHGGTLSGVPNNDHGATFRFVLPACAEERPVALAAGAMPTP